MLIIVEYNNDTTQNTLMKVEKKKTISSDGMKKLVEK